MKLHATVAVDHVTVYCKELPLLTDVFNALGFNSLDGKHYMFAKNYLEGYAPKEGEHYDFFPSQAGLHSFIFWSDDPEASYKALVDAGYEMAMPVLSFERPAVIDGKEYPAKFRGAYLATPLFPLSESALVQQVTPDLVYAPGCDEHPNAVNAIEEFYLCIPDEAEAQKAQQMLERTSALIQGSHPLHACVNDLTIAGPAYYQQAFGVSVDPARSCVTGIRFSSRDFAKTRAAVQASGLPWQEKDGGLVVDATAQLNLFLHFAP